MIRQAYRRIEERLLRPRTLGLARCNILNVSRWSMHEITKGLLTRLATLIRANRHPLANGRGIGGWLESEHI